MIEEWRPIAGYGNRYEVSSLGRVRVSRYMRKSNVPIGYVLARNKGIGGYLSVALSCDKKRYGRLVHRLVLDAFVGPCPKNHESRHLDGNSGNPHLCNLKWGTKAENCHDKIIHDTISIGERNGSAKLKPSEVTAIRLGALDGESQNSLARKFSVTQANIWRILKRQTWAHLP